MISFVYIVLSSDKGKIMAIVAQADGVKFGRTKDKTRVPVFFEFSTDAADDLPVRYRYSAKDEDWSPDELTGFSSNLLSSTSESLGLTATKYKSDSKGVSSNGKVWRVKVLTAVGNVTRSSAGVPTGSPPKYTVFSIPVPSWLSVFLFAHSVFKALEADSNVFIGSGDNSPAVGDIVSFISPSGVTYSPKQIKQISDAAEPPDGSGGVIEA